MIDYIKKHSVFTGASLATLIVALWGIITPDSFTSLANRLMGGLTSHFSWLYLYGMLFFVLFSIVIIFSRYGSIRLGRDDERPEYSRLSWFAMLFAGGMGVGLVFWGVAEPLSHFVAPPPGVEAGTPEAQIFALRSCFMHWGFQDWAAFALMGLGMAYMEYRKGQKGLVSSIFSPILGENVSERPVGRFIDGFSAFVTLIGLSTSFGLGCIQISGGLNYLFNIPDTVLTWIIIIIAACCCYLASSITGISRGIKSLSNFNIILFVGIMLVILIFGPTATIFGNMGLAVRDFLVHYFPDSIQMSIQGDRSWIQSWRVFYYAWVLSWTPFVGSFTARISRGRTIREYLIGVIVVPTLVTIVWFSILGGTAFHVADLFSMEELTSIAYVPQTAVFEILGKYPFGMILSVITMVLLFTFFITSADSTTFVLAMLSADGEQNPSNRIKIFWGVLLAVVAFALVLSGGVSGIQTISIVIAFPYLFLLLFMCISLIRMLRTDKKLSPALTK